MVSFLACQFPIVYNNVIKVLLYTDLSSDWKTKLKCLFLSVAAATHRGTHLRLMFVLKVNQRPWHLPIWISPWSAALFIVWKHVVVTQAYIYTHQQGMLMKAVQDQWPIEFWYYNYIDIIKHRYALGYLWQAYIS